MAVFPIRSYVDNSKNFQTQKQSKTEVINFTMSLKILEIGARTFNNHLLQYLD